MVKVENMFNSNNNNSNSNNVDDCDAWNKRFQVY